MAVPAIHPGEHLAEELKALNMSAAALARQLKVPTNRITEILNGERSITGGTALRLAHFFGTSAQVGNPAHVVVLSCSTRAKPPKNLRASPGREESR